MNKIQIKKKIKIQNYLELTLDLNLLKMLKVKLLLLTLGQINMI